MANNNQAFTPAGTISSLVDNDWLNDPGPAVAWDGDLSFYFVAALPFSNQFRVAAFLPPTGGGRGHYNRALVDSNGNLYPNSTVRIIDPADGLTTLAADIFVDALTPVTKPNPFVTETGVVDFYLATPQRVTLGITRPGIPGEFFITGADVLAPDTAPPPAT